MENIPCFTPYLPEEGRAEHFDLIEKATAVSEAAAALRASFNAAPDVIEAIGDLTCNMNCYYSNLIEGHNTYPIDIDKALHQQFSHEPKKRDLQKEAWAHIETQRHLDKTLWGRLDGRFELLTPETLSNIHRLFFEKLPEDLLWVENLQTGERFKIIPGKFREKGAKVGMHIAPSSEQVLPLLHRWAEVYDPESRRRYDRVIAAACLHHRSLWIHPFAYGNGRVARLITDAYLKHLGICGGLWSVSRGLARNHVKYKALLAAADEPRHGEYDGRGALSHQQLVKFCHFFLDNCLDQITFMERLLRPAELMKRIRGWSAAQVAAKHLPAGSDKVIERLFSEGRLERSEISGITGYKERQSRTILEQLTEKGLISRSSPKGALYPAFPATILKAWFPGLYPDEVV